MRWSPNGHFLVGSGMDDLEAWDDEKPQHKVTIRRGFWMGQTPVTQRQYQAVMGVNPSYFKGASLDVPVECVSWYDAAAFANKISILEGLPPCFVGDDEEMRGVGDEGSDYLRCKGWRLPTEVEWEYAARAGTATSRYGELDKIAWYHDNSSRMTHPVGVKQANSWGLYDMLGNVFEWCYDWHQGYSCQATIDPVGVARGTTRVSRGGGWDSDKLRVRAAFRNWFAPLLRFGNLGFRLVRSSD
jgi:formylglycine-generating enzyme required for sulfatase activity